ncbi:MAG: hypothetical protein EXS16_07720 [Gemmataceae bacterium]|nr:hypothetical protein [Gemmataceae bacterium]
MSIQCNVCGEMSQDHEFCDHCNAELASAAPSPPPAVCPVTSAGLALSTEQRQALAFPESALTLTAEGQSWRVHWLPDKLPAERVALLEERLATQAACLPKGRVVDDSQGRWLIFDTNLSTPLPWQLPKAKDDLAELQRLSACVHSVAHALSLLHERGLVWLNFNPSMMEDIGPLSPSVNDSTSADWRWLRITNLDLELFPSRMMPERVRIHPHYAAPEIVQFLGNEIGPATDVFHLAMLAYYWLAGLIPGGFPGNGLEAFRYEIPPLRIFTPRLPTGIIPVIQRGTALNPGLRFPTPLAFAQAFDEAIVGVNRRRTFSGTLRSDADGHTRTGRSKTELQRNNEDAILVKADERGLLAVVADGVSTCDVGSGGLASMITSIVVENAFIEGCTHETFARLVSDAARQSSQGLLEWALAHGSGDELRAGENLMGTTLTIAWLQGHELSIANLGDSRAYLITKDAIEQLTVDGDVASDLLANGASPEEIHELGSVSRSLRECVGGCIVNERGELAILAEYCKPKVSRWPLLPGDVVMLCSDGLIEEGYFLEPHNAAAMVRNMQSAKAADIALSLVNAADAMQRLPSVLEPDGFGDNISCVIIKVYL